MHGVDEPIVPVLIDVVPGLEQNGSQLYKDGLAGQLCPVVPKTT